MELKQPRALIELAQSGLLIVPYGIETTVSYEDILKEVALLIVPYGIETIY